MLYANSVNRTMNAILTVIRDSIPRTERRIAPMPMHQTSELSKESILLPGLRKAFGVKASEHSNLLPELASQSQQLIENAVRNHVIDDRTVGALVGLAIGDSAGAPLEFLPARNALEKETATESENAPCLLRNVHPETEELQYQSPFNKFKLLHGQWTDDSSMALCLADSLLANDGFNGSDCRVRWYDWWNFGYNKSFRYDTRADRTSVDLEITSQYRLTQ